MLFFFLRIGKQSMSVKGERKIARLQTSRDVVDEAFKIFSSSNKLWLSANVDENFLCNLLFWLLTLNMKFLKIKMQKRLERSVKSMNESVTSIEKYETNEKNCKKYY